MKLKIKFLGLEAGGKPVVVLNKDDAEELGIRSLGRAKLHSGKNEMTVIVNITKHRMKGLIGFYEEVENYFGLKEGSEIEVEIAKFPVSLVHIINRLKGRKLTFEEINEIVKDVVEGNLSEIEIAAFVTTLNNFGLDLEEAANLSMAMIQTGDRLKLKKKIILDKHSVGGVPGDKTTLLVVPIIAANGFAIPKTSSRAITSAAGTADRAETLMPVSLNVDEMKKIVEKTNGCIIWGGALRLAPADDIFIQVEFPLSIDPMLLPSIMGKKKAVGATHLVIDIPTGRGTKMKTIGDSDLLAKDFITLGDKLGIKTQCALTYGEQPIGHAIGPALEAREALEVLTRAKYLVDVIDKACHIAGMLLEMAGKKDGEILARETIKSGKAEKKLREIIAAQGGDDKIRPEDMKIGDCSLDVHAEKSGIVLWINNTGIVELARTAGTPKDHGAGVYIYKKLGDRVNKGDKLFTIYSEKNSKLIAACKLMEENNIIGIGDKMEMLIHKVMERHVHRKTFFLER
ncbi:MAG: AMP phosphorylase [Candidatus Aenigmatarchaeota archaeon]